MSGKKIMLVLWIIAGVGALLLRFKGLLFISWWMWIIYAVILLALIGSLLPDDDKKAGPESENADDEDDIDREIAEALGETPPSDDCVDTISRLLEAAEKGDAKAQCQLGMRCAKGDGVDQNLAEAVKWYAKAAEQGDPVAQRFLGKCYYLGEGVEKNKTEALKWYAKAAEQNDTAAMENTIECCYELGKFQEAEAFAERFSSSDAGKSYRLLGNLCEDDEKYTEAAKYFGKAADLGDESAQNSLDELECDGKI